MRSSLRLKIASGSDGAWLAWHPGREPPSWLGDCLGFAIQRSRTMPSGKTETYFLPNRLGFPPRKLAKAMQSGAAPRPPREAVSSLEQPFQDFTWFDADLDSGDAVRYRLIPVLGKAGHAQPLEEAASLWSAPRMIGPNGGANRLLINGALGLPGQIERLLKAQKIEAAEFKPALADRFDHALRGLLDAGLKPAWLAEIARAQETGGQLHVVLAAWPGDSLGDALLKAGRRLHLLLGRVSDAERQKLRRAEVTLHRREQAAGPLARNGFLVASNAEGRPQRVLVNAEAGEDGAVLCQRSGLLIQDEKAAQHFRARFDQLAFRAKAADSPGDFGGGGKSAARGRAYFVHGQAAIAALQAALGRARQGALYLLADTHSPWLQAELALLSANPDLFLRGVAARRESGALELFLQGRRRQGLLLDLPPAPKPGERLGAFASTIAKQGLEAGFGHAAPAAHLIAIDPFSARPIVIAGGSDLSEAGLSGGDQNMILIENDAALAEAAAVHILAHYAQYRWRSGLARPDLGYPMLTRDAAWLETKLPRAEALASFLNF